MMILKVFRQNRLDCGNLTMKKNYKQKLSLDQPAIYRIKVPGVLDEKWLDWDGDVMITVECDLNKNPISTLSITIDQAGLQGLLRYLYSLGLPLIEVAWVDFQ